MNKLRVNIHGQGMFLGMGAFPVCPRRAKDIPDH
jgi:hypothetical protein